MAQIVLRPLTPLWTGDSERMSRHVRATGILGSMRWWWEGLVRGHGWPACDPTEGGCTREDDGGICAGCWLFGTTGWSRRFRLRTQGLGLHPWYVVAHGDVARVHQSWLTRIYPPGSVVLWGDKLEVGIEDLYGVKGDGWDVEGVVGGLLEVIAKWGAIGAKAQNGYGAVEWRSESTREKLEAFFKSPPKGISTRGRNDAKWFNTNETVYVRFTVDSLGEYERRGVRIPAGANQGFDGRVFPIAYDIRYKRAGDKFHGGEEIGLRPLLKNLAADYVDDYSVLVGSSARSSERSASRVHVNHLYRRERSSTWEGRIWIHVPGEDIPREEVGEEVMEYVEKRMIPGGRARVVQQRNGLEVSDEL